MWLKAMRITHKYCFSSCWYMASSQVWLECNRGWSWAAAGYRGVAVPPVLATGHGELELVLLPFHGPPTALFLLGCALALTQSLSNASDYAPGVRQLAE